MNTGSIFEGFNGYISFISTLIGCFPDDVLDWFLVIFTSTLFFALAKYLIDIL